MLKGVVRASLRRLGYEIRRGPFTWDDLVSQALSKLIRFDDVRIVFDVGAFDGGTTQAFLKCFPRTHVHAFEPLADSYEKLACRFVANTRVSSVNCAICEADREIELFATSSPQSNSILRPLQTGRFVDDSHFLIGSTKVRGSSIDSYCDTNSIERIDVLKLDIQGGELAALKGAVGMLERRAIDIILSEVEFVELYEAQPLFCDILSCLKGYGYSLYAFPRQLPDEIGQLCWADAIFCRNDILQAARSGTSRATQ